MEEKITAWIARDKDDRLYLYIDCKPCKNINDERWVIENGVNYDAYYRYIPNDNFLKVKWEDEEPTKVELTIKVCK